MRAKNWDWALGRGRVAIMRKTSQVEVCARNCPGPDGTRQSLPLIRPLQTEPLISDSSALEIGYDQTQARSKLVMIRLKRARALEIALEF